MPREQAAASPACVAGPRRRRDRAPTHPMLTPPPIDRFPPGTRGAPSTATPAAGAHARAPRPSAGRGPRARPRPPPARRSGAPATKSRPARVREHEVRACAGAMGGRRHHTRPLTSSMRRSRPLVAHMRTTQSALAFVPGAAAVPPGSPPRRRTTRPKTHAPSHTTAPRAFAPPIASRTLRRTCSFSARASTTVDDSESRKRSAAPRARDTSTSCVSRSKSRAPRAVSSPAAARSAAVSAGRTAASPLSLSPPSSSSPAPSTNVAPLRVRDAAPCTHRVRKRATRNSSRAAWPSAACSCVARRTTPARVAKKCTAAVRNATRAASVATSRGNAAAASTLEGQGEIASRRRRCAIGWSAVAATAVATAKR